MADGLSVRWLQVVDGSGTVTMFKNGEPLLLSKKAWAAPKSAKKVNEDSMDAQNYFLGCDPIAEGLTVQSVSNCFQGKRRSDIP